MKLAASVYLALAALFLSRPPTPRADLLTVDKVMKQLDSKSLIATCGRGSHGCGLGSSQYKA
jgi:hypothetical protein